MTKKKKRLYIVVAIFGGFVLLAMIAGIQSANERTEDFNANKVSIIQEFETALSDGDLAKCEELNKEYGVANDDDLNVLIDQFKSKKKAVKEAEKLAKKQAQEAEKYARVGVPFSGDVLEVNIKKVRITDRVGGSILGESSKTGVMYFVCEYSYKNISKQPTREAPTLSLESPDGAVYSPDVSAGALAASASDDYDEEILSELQPQVYSNGIEVFEVPSSIGDGWKLKVTIEDGGFSRGITKIIPLSK